MSRLKPLCHSHQFFFHFSDHEQSGDSAGTKSSNQDLSPPNKKKKGGIIKRLFKKMTKETKTRYGRTVKKPAPFHSSASQ
jgi:hypothetical protein